MNILIATNNVHIPQQYGGSELSIEELVLSLQEYGHDVRVLASLNNSGSVYYINRFKSYLSNKMFPFDKTRGYIVYRGWGHNKTVEHGIKEVLNCYTPDIFVIQGTNIMKLTDEVYDFGIPMMVSFVDVESSNLSKKPTPTKNIIYRANSKFTANKVHDKFGLKCCVISPIIRVEKYFTKTSRQHVTFVNPHPFKGCELVVKLARKNPKIPFVFQESWPLTADYKRQLMEILLTLPNVQYKKPTLDMKSLYATTKLLLVPSMWEEAWGRVVNEAQVSGIPVIASNRGGLPESVGNGGIIIPYDADFTEWDNNLNELWSNTETYNFYSHKAFERMNSGELSKSTLIKKYFDSFDKLNCKITV